MARRVIITELDENGNVEHQYPLTTTENVFDESGVQLSDILENKAEKEHEHDYVRQEQIMPLSTLNNYLDGKANLVHTHSQYLTQDDINRDNNLSRLQSLDQIDQVQNGDDGYGNPTYESVVRNHTKMDKSQNQYALLEKDTIIDLPTHTDQDEFLKLNLYVELNVSGINVTLPSLSEESSFYIVWDRDMTNFTFETGKIYLFTFTTVLNKWVVDIKIY